MIRKIFLDLDDTIFDFKAAERLAITKTLSEFGFVATEETIARYSEINRLQWERLERGEASREEILSKRFDILFSELGLSARGCEVKAVYEKNLSGCAPIIPGAIELLEALFTKYDLYLASNGTAKVQDGRLAISGIGKYFKNIFISERVGYNKPRREFFEECIKEIPDFSFSEAIIVGDSITSDIRGGKNAGILTCLYNPKGKAFEKEDAPDYEIRKLSELPTLLEKI